MGPTVFGERNARSKQWCVFLIVAVPFFVTCIRFCIDFEKSYCSKNTFSPDKDTMNAKTAGVTDDLQVGLDLRSHAQKEKKDYHGNQLPTCEMTDRLEHVRRACSQRSQLDGDIAKKAAYRNILVDDKREVLYCFIPKVACTTFKAILVSEARGRDVRALTESYKGNYWHNNTNLASIGILTLDSYPELEIQKRLRNYYKFMVVRHPLDRLYSAYKNKMDYQNPQNNTVSPVLFAGLRRHFNISTTRFDFSDFVHVIAIDYEQNWISNAHWQLYHKRCQPCTIQYDAILKTETIQQDSRLVLSRYGYNDVISLPILNAENEGNDGSMRDAFPEAYNYVAAEDMKLILDKYSPDMDLFGYDWDVGTQKPNCAITARDGSSCC